MKRLFSLLLAVAMLMTMLPQVAVFASEEQTDTSGSPETVTDETPGEVLTYVCPHCDQEVQWQPYGPATSTLTGENAHYYIPEGGYSHSAMVTIRGDVTVDLHGNVLTAADGKRLWRVMGTLNLLDTVGEGSAVGTGMSGATGGLLMTAKDSDTGSMPVINMYSGKLSVTENAQPAANGGIMALSVGAFNMYGGEISGGTAKNAHANNVYISGGSFRMYGGYIDGGVELYKASEVVLGGDAGIGNNAGGLHITNGNTVDVTDLGANAKIFISASNAGVFTNPLENPEEKLSCFISAEAGLGVIVQEGALALSDNRPAVDVNDIYDYACDMDFTTGDAEGNVQFFCPVCRVEVQWQPLPVNQSGKSVVLAEGHYYLSENADYTLNNALYSITGGKQVCLNLNHQNLTSAVRAFYTEGNETVLSIMGEGVITGSGMATATTVRGVLDLTGNTNLFGGTYISNVYEAPAVEMRKTSYGEAWLNIYQGTEIYNSQGGNALVLKSNSNASIAGGRIGKLYTEKHSACLKLTNNPVMIAGMELSDPSLLSAEGLCGDSAGWRFQSGTLEIYGEGQLHHYAAEGDAAAPWSSFAPYINSVVIGENITGIGSYAFYSCTGLQEVLYKGTAQQWQNVSVSEGNEPLTNRNVQFAEGVVSLTVDPITLVEGVSCGEGSSEQGNYPYYNWYGSLRYYVTMSDGTVVEGRDHYFNYNGKEYNLTYRDTQSYENRWTVGNTYFAEVSVSGITVMVPVTIVESPVASVYAHPLTLTENMYGDVFSDAEGTSYYHYCWWNELQYTIYMRNGEAVEAYGTSFYYDGEYYSLTTTDNQQEQHWTAGNTYAASGSVFGMEFPVSVTVAQNPIADITFQPVEIMQESGGYWQEGSGGASYYYQWWNLLKYTVTFADGTVESFSGVNFTHNGVEYSLDAYDNQYGWEPGSEQEGTVSVMGREYTVSIAIKRAEVVNIVPYPMSIPAGSCGALQRSRYNGELFFQYRWWEQLRYTVTFADEITMEVTGDTFTYNDTTYVLTHTDDQDMTPWRAGNTYEVGVSVPGCGVSASVTINGTQPEQSVYPELRTDVDNEVNITERDGLAVFRFVPQESGTYSFCSYSPTNDDTYGYLLDSDFNTIVRDDDGNSNLQFRVEGYLTAGETYYVVARFLGSDRTGSFVVRMSACVSVTGIAFEPVILYAGSGGQMTSDAPDTPQYYRYYWWNNMQYTVYMETGESFLAGGNGFYYGDDYYKVTHQDNQSWENPWGVGTHEVTVTVSGQTFALTVQVLESPVRDVKLFPVTVYQCGNGYYTTAWNDQTEMQEEFFRYYWWEHIPYEVTMNTGEVLTGIGSGFSYNNSWTGFDWEDDGQFTNHWEPGNTYYGYVTVAGQRYELPVYVQPMEISRVTVEPLVMMANTNGYWENSYSGEHYVYYWWENMRWTVEFANGETVSGVGSSFSYRDSWINIHFNNDQNYDNAYTVGNTYSNTIRIFGYEAQVQVSITDSVGGQAGENAIWTLDSEGNLRISGTGEMFDYPGSYYAPWSAYRENTRTLTVEEGITNVSRFAFYGCYNLESVTLSSTVLNIGDYAFYDCVNMRQLELGSSVERIGDHAFSYCTNLTELWLPASVRFLGDWAFYPCPDMGNIYFMGTRKALERVEFWGYPGFDRAQVNCMGVAEKIAEGVCGELTWELDADGLLTFSGEGQIPDFTDFNQAQWSVYAGFVTEIQLGSGVTAVGDYAFANFQALCDFRSEAVLTRIGSYSFFQCDMLFSVNLCGVQEVGSYAFFGCDNLRVVAMSASSTVIGDYAFGDTYLEEVEYNGPAYRFYQEQIGEGNQPLLNATVYGQEESGVIRSGRLGETVYWIHYETGELFVFGEGETFHYISSPWEYMGYPIFSITVDEGITCIGEDAFAHCGNARELKLPSTLTRIDNEAFFDLANVKTVNIPEGVEYIGHNAFAGSGMEQLNLPLSLKSIGHGAFEHCSSLETVTIPAGVEMIDECAFLNCNAMTAIYVDEDNAYYSSDDRGVLYNKDKTLLVAAPTFISGSFTVPETVQRIGNYAFAYCKNLTEVIMGDHVTELGVFAFNGCYALNNVTLGSGITTLPGGLFMEAGLETFEIPDSVTAIGSHVFQGCEHLSRVVIPESVTEIGEYAFAYCWVLAEANIPKSVTSLGQYAFYQCDMLTTVTVDEGVTQIGAFAFADCPTLTTVILPQSVESIGAYAFIGCTNLTALTMSDNVTAIGDSAFEGCTALTQVKVPAGVTELVYRMFAGCTSLENITIPENVVSIGDMTFADCNTLTEVTVPDSVASIGDFAFKQCENLSVVNLGKNVSYLGANVFHASMALSKINVHAENTIYSSDEKGVLYEDAMLLRCPPMLEGEMVIREGTEAIFETAFNGCINMRAVTVPGSVGGIPFACFEDCYGLTSVTLNEGVRFIDACAFRGCTALSEIRFPDTVDYIETEAFRNCYSLQSVELPESIGYVPSYLFADCFNLTTVTIPANIRSIQECAFLNCPLTTVYYGGTRAQWQEMEIGYDNFALNNAQIIFADEEELLASGQCGEALVWTLTAAGKLTVSGSGLMDDYGNATLPWNAYRKDIRVIEIQQGVESIGTAAFWYTPNLTEVHVAGSVETVGNSAFLHCEALWDVQLGYGVNNIGVSAFAYTAIENIVLPESLDTIGSHCFAYCTGLREICIPAATYTIGTNPFFGCSSLTGIWVDPANQRFMSDELGVLYNKLGTVIYAVPGALSGAYTPLEKLITIRPQSFAHCANLTQISLPLTLRNIQNQAFEGCTALTDMYYAGSEQDWATVNIDESNQGLPNITVHFAVSGNIAEGTWNETTWVLDRDGNMRITGIGAWGEGTLTMEDIPWNALRDEIVTVTIEGDCIRVPDHAFSYCSNLVQVNLPDTVRQIGRYAFYDCDGLTSVFLHSGLEALEAYAFADCDSLQSANTNEGIETIMESAFYSCDSLSAFYFPTTLVGIGQQAFANTALTSVILPGNMQYVENYAFEDCHSLTEVTVETSKLTCLGDGIFCNCTSLQSVTLGDSITVLGDQLFYGCSALENVVLSSALTDIGPNCFAECKKLTSLYIPAGVTVINDNVFYNCESLSSIVMGEITHIGSYAFYNTAFHALSFSDSLEVVGVGAFAWCEDLETVYLGNGVTDMGTGLFSGCQNLRSLEFPKSMNYIPSYTFEYCYKLDSITIGTALVTVDYCAFVNAHVENVFYDGTLSDWQQITVIDGNDALMNANIICAEKPENVYFCPHCSCEVNWESWNGLTHSGHYRLTSDYYTSTAMVGSATHTGNDFVLDLNGYGLYADSRAFSVFRGNTLTVLDTVGSGVISGGASTAIGGAVLVTGGTFHMLGGTVTSQSNNSGGCVYVTNNGSFNMRGGQLIGGYLSGGRRGGALYVAENCYADLSSGLITDGNARGASIYAANYSSLNLGNVTVGEVLAANGTNLCLYGSPVVDALDLTSGARLNFTSLASGTRITVYADDVFTYGLEDPEAVIGYFISGFEDTVITAQDGMLRVTYPFESEVADITVMEMPLKTQYEQGEALELDGLLLLAYYANGYEELVEEGWEISGFDSQTPGIKTVYVTYSGCTTSFNLRVNERRVTGMQIHNGPGITEYFVGDYLDLAGLELLVTYSNGDQEIIGAGYEVDTVYLDEVGQRTVTVYFNGYRDTFQITVKSKAVEITKQPESLVIKENETAQFHVEANNVVSYRWQCDQHNGKGWYNTTMSGYKTDTLTVQATLARSGYSFRCALTDMDGNVTYTDIVTLEVIPAVITVTGIYLKQVPHKLVYTVGEELELAGLVLYASYSYGDDGMVESGYTVSGFDTNTPGEQLLTVSYEGATTQFAVTVMAPAGEITSQPVDVNADSGTAVTFSVGVMGEVVSYQWQYSTGDGNWYDTTMSSSNAATLSLNAVGYRHNYRYRCVVTFANGNVETSAEAVLTVNTVIRITGNPNNQVIVLGYNGQFTVAAEGEGLTYQWQYKRPDGERWIDTTMEGADRPTVYVETTKARDGYQYRCCITDATGNVAYSEAATMTVLSFVSQPTDGYAPVNGTVQFTVKASAESGFTYQWQYRRSATANWTNTTMTGYNTATLTVSATKARNGYQYRCVLTGAKNSKLESDAVTLHVSEPVTITAQPQSAVATASENAVFTVEASNVLSYQWYYKRPTGSTWYATSAEGNKTASLTVPAKGKNGYQYRCVITGMDGQEYTTDIALLVVGTGNAVLTAGMWKTLCVADGRGYDITLDLKNGTFVVGYGDDVEKLDFVPFPEETAEIDGKYYYFGSGDSDSITYTVSGDTITVVGGFFTLVLEKVSPTQLRLVRDDGLQVPVGITLELSPF